MAAEASNGTVHAVLHLDAASHGPKESRAPRASGHHGDMGCTWFSVVVDCDDPVRLAEFWCQVLGYHVVDQSDDIVDIAQTPQSFPGIEFIRTARHDSRKGPFHLDLNPDDQDDEVARLIALGARRVDVGQGSDASWVVLADPEDNPFCVLAPQAGWTRPS